MFRFIIIFVILIGAAVIGVAAHSHRDSAVTNLAPPITDLKKWHWRAFGPANGGVTVDQGGVRIDVLQVDGTNMWKLELFHLAAPLKDHQKYRLSFSTKAASTFVFEVSAMSKITDPFSAHGNASPVGLHEEVEANKEWSQKTFTFMTKDVDGFPNQVPMFTVGTMTGSLWIKDVTLTEVN